MPPWGHKPPAVNDIQQCWTTPPPELSPRVEYWLRRVADDDWRPNKYLLREDYYGASTWLGVYIWEWINLLRPLLAELEENNWRQPDDRLEVDG